MSTENPVAQRLVNDARKKTARQGSPLLAWIALGISILAVPATLWPFFMFGYPPAWALGLAGVITGAVAVQRSVARKTAWAACIIGFLAICVGTFFFTLVISRLG